MIVFEVFITALVIIAAVLGVAAWITRPLWTALWRRYRHEEAEERRVRELDAQVALRRAETERQARESAATEVRDWIEGQAGEKQEEQACRHDASPSNDPQ